MRKIILLLLSFLFASQMGAAADLYVGMSNCSITPDKPIMLAGQFPRRKGTVGENPVEAHILAIESRLGETRKDCALVISLDVASISGNLYVSLREMIQKEIPDFDLSKLIVAATHTHTSAVQSDTRYELYPDVMKPSEWCVWASKRIANTARKAWESRQKAKFSYGLGHAVVGYNRRAIYADGSAVMYGKTAVPEFRGMEGMEDHDVNSMFFWDEQDKLLGMLVNVSCPSQEIEHYKEISSDFWGPARKKIKSKYGQDITIVTLCGAAGDLSPHIQYMKSASLRMDKLRKLDRIDEIGRRIFRAVDDTYEAVVEDKQTQPVVRNLFEYVNLPQRIPTLKEYEQCLSEIERLKSKPINSRLEWNQRIIERYKDLEKNPNPTMWTTVNVLRIGDAVLCTNQFELYTDFAVQIKARSKAIQTFIVQLSSASGEYLKSKDPKDISLHGASGTYLPSERAVQGGGYGAVIQSNSIGPEGGQILVTKTLEMIDKAFCDKTNEQSAAK